MSKQRDSLKKSMNTVLFDKVYLESNKIKSKLTFKNNEAIFNLDKKLMSEQTNIGLKFLKSWSGGEKVYYTNSIFKKNKVKNCKTLGECFVIESNFKDWTLTQQTKYINKYLCFKATRKLQNDNIIIAWYTNQIPVNFGPKDNNGLPGLILELEEPTIVFKATKIILNPNEEIIIQEPKKGIAISEKEYKKKVKKVSDGIFGKRRG